MSRGFFRALARDAAGRYPARDRFAGHFAYGKLTRDPAFEYLLAQGLVRAGEPLADIGCGQGLIATLLDAARTHHERGDWPVAWPAPARPSRVRGIDLSARDIARAQAALPSGEWIAGDMRNWEPGPAGTIILLDVLHYIGRADQERLLGRVAAAMAAGGVLIARVGDADRSVRFRVTLAVDRLAMALRGRGLPELHCRPVAEWLEALRGHGLDARAVAMSRGTPFANTLLVARPA